MSESYLTTSDLKKLRYHEVRICYINVGGTKLNLIGQKVNLTWQCWDRPGVRTSWNTKYFTGDYILSIDSKSLNRLVIWSTFSILSLSKWMDSIPTRKMKTGNSLLMDVRILAHFIQVFFPLFLNSSNMY